MEDNIEFIQALALQYGVKVIMALAIVVVHRLTALCCPCWL